MIITELLLAAMTPLTGLVIKCVKDEIDILHRHLIQRIEDLERQLHNSTPSESQ